MVDDAILSKEAYLLYQNAYGFEPDKGNLTSWKGVVRDRSGQAVSITVNIPHNFPNTPPEIYFPKGTSHAIADQNGQIITRTMQRWKNTNHVYQVIREVRQGISSSNFANAITVNARQQDDALNRQIVNLKQQLIDKEVELKMLINSKVENTTLDPRAIAEESLMNVQADLYALEESYDRLELDEVEFFKLYMKLRKRYFMIENSLN